MEAFSSQDFIEKMVGYLCFEENKGKDKYSSDKAALFKVCSMVWEGSAGQDHVNIRRGGENICGFI